MNYARIEKGVVREIIDVPQGMNIGEMFHASLIWMPCPSATKEGDVVMDGVVVPQDNYRVLRAAEYPPLSDKADAEVKMLSADPVVQAAGQAQLNDYVNKCFAVKLKYPRP